MSIFLTAIAIVSACVFLFYFSMSLRASISGGGFRTIGDLIVIVAILLLTAMLALWLGPIGLAGMGVL